MELSLMCRNKFSSVIFPVCPFSLPKGISRHQGCSLPQLCSAVRAGFPTGSGLQAELSFWEKQRCLDFRETLAHAAQLGPLQRDDPALLGKRKSTNSSLISGPLRAFQFWFPSPQLSQVSSWIGLILQKEKASGMTVKTRQSFACRKMSDVAATHSLNAMWNAS